MKSRKRHIPIFMTASDESIAALSVTLQSISDHSNDECIYEVRILTPGLAPYNQRKLRHMKLSNVDLYIVDISGRLSEYRQDFKVRLGDYYSEEIFYLFYAPNMYPRVGKALHFECGTLLLCDAEALLSVDMCGAMLGGLSILDEDGRKYVERWVGVDPDHYVDSSAMLLNFNLFRKNKIEERFTRLLTGYNFDTVSPLDDYLNFLMIGNSVSLNKTWFSKDEKPMLVTFRAYKKPWHYVNIPYADEFWDTARRTPFYDDIRDKYIDFNDEAKQRQLEFLNKILAHRERLTAIDGGFYATLGDNYLATRK